MSNVIEILTKHLIDGGYDGLCLVDAECGCLLSDLQPCGESFAKCEPWYKGEDPDSPGDWLVFKKKPIGER